MCNGYVRYRSAFRLLGWQEGRCPSFSVAGGSWFDLDIEKELKFSNLNYLMDFSAWGQMFSDDVSLKSEVKN